MRGERASRLLRTPVLVRGIRLGEVESVLLDASEPRIVGFAVLCGDGANRFLPLATADVVDGALELESTLMLLDPRELDFYRTRTRSLASVPELADARIGPDGVLLQPLATPLS